MPMTLKSKKAMEKLGVTKKTTRSGVAKKTAPKPSKASNPGTPTRKAQEPTGYAKGGETKSRVNEAGNYTKPTMRKNLFNKIKAGGKGGKPGQWSARKAQMLAQEYKKKGGGYKS